MEVIILIAIIIIIYKTSGEAEKFVEIANLKVGKNPNEHFDEDAFTEVYLLRKGNRDGN